ncbi:MAG: hypothetical protein ACE5ER_11150 [Nitrospinaceae bacterium]
MIYPVRVFKSNGNLKKEIPSKALSKKYWKDFTETVRTNIQISTKQGRKRVKEAILADPAYDQEVFCSED